MRVSLLIADLVLLACGQASADQLDCLEWDALQLPGVCRKPVTVGGRPDAYVCAGHVKGSPPGEIRSGMIGAGMRSCYVPGEVEGQDRRRRSSAFALRADRLHCTNSACCKAKRLAKSPFAGRCCR